jgi:hypothetical protein
MHIFWTSHDLDTLFYFCTPPLCILEIIGKTDGICISPFILPPDVVIHTFSKITTIGEYVQHSDVLIASPNC